jgi:outer membrane protein OmpA-like peptidoglycan-associated protein
MNPVFAARRAAAAASTAFLFAACGALGAPPASAQEPVAIGGVCGNREFNVYFDEWKAELTQDARDAIATVQRDLQGCAIQHVRIVGLAGARGGEVDNLNVSMARAEAIARTLEEGGWPADHFELAALGEAGATVDGVARPMRRRARVIVTAAPASTS